jgi:catechol 2,3-dioxygenase-like lactoylglutathione lyase family enzyme
MHFNKMSTVLLCDDLKTAARFFVQVLGFEQAFDMGWFATLRHSSGATIDLWLRQHETLAFNTNSEKGGVVLAFVVSDAKAEATRLAALEADIVKPLDDHPWGQRSVMIRGPEGLLIDIVQPIAHDASFLREHGG